MKQPLIQHDPEQALGGEVTPAADLYSLGAMLYELVTGKPPFAGESPTAIISQHINTPPVAPAWHSEHCPPDLEALILQLLAKVPAERPSSATEVLEALERVDPEARSASHSDSSANPLDRLARGVFVGREHELERLRRAFDEAFSGRGSVVMLAGEPGIGKTRTVMELETYARLRGARVIWGRAHEAAGAPPYRPWAQAADGYSSTFGLDGVADAVSVEDTAELSRIFPLLRQQRGYVPPPEIVDPASGQFRLFEAYTHMVGAFASEAPLVVVLDDLHWSDKPSLQLLQHVARELGRMRVLVIGTYRDTELSRTHPLSETLADLNRGGGFQRISLSGLTQDEVGMYVRGVALITPSHSLVERVHAETEGNPFFVSEVVNLMTEEGTISKASISDIAVPEGVREALGRRLDRLTEDANALLGFAAVAGREFSYDTLAGLSDRDDERLLQLVEEGLGARVIEETGRAGGYRFTHALMQETLLAELSTTRRVRMHGQVADVIEARYGGRAEEQAARLAKHYRESASMNPSHAEKALHYSSIAGRAAAAVAAWSEAARHLEAAIALVDEHLVPQPVDFAELLTLLGRAKRQEGDARPGWRALMRARESFREHNDPAGVVEATLEALTYLAPPERTLSILDEAAQMLPDDALAMRATLAAERLRLRAAWGGATALEIQSELPAVTQLVDTAGSDYARAVLVEAYGALAHRSGDAVRISDLMSASREYERLGYADRAAYARLYLAQYYCLAGDLDSAVESSRDGVSFARRVGATAPLRGFLRVLGGVALARSDSSLASIIADQRSVPGNWYGAQIEARLLERRAEFTKALKLVHPPPDDPRPDAVGATAGDRARILANDGEDERAAAELALWELNYDRVQFADDAIVRVGGTDAARSAYARLRSPEGDGIREVEAAWVRLSEYGTSQDRMRGDLALRLELVDEAEQHFVTGLEFCERERCDIEAGRCHQGLAELAERRGDIEEARVHLDAAGALFAKHGAKLYLEQVLAKKSVLGA